EASHEIAVPAGLPQALCYEHEQLISRGMPEVVVDRLELVEIHVDHAGRHALLPCELALQGTENGGAVATVGEGIETRAPLELQARACAVCDVEHADDRAVCLAARSQERPHAEQGSAPRARGQLEV